LEDDDFDDDFDFGTIDEKISPEKKKEA